MQSAPPEALQNANLVNQSQFIPNTVLCIFRAIQWNFQLDRASILYHFRAWLFQAEAAGSQAAKH